MNSVSKKKKIINEENVKLVKLDNIELFNDVSKLEDFPIPEQVVRQTAKYKDIKPNYKEETKLEDFPITNVKINTISQSEKSNNKIKLEDFSLLDNKNIRTQDHKEKYHRNR